MKKSIKILLVGVLMAVSGGVFAEGKIAVFDLQGAILNTDAAQQQFKELRAKTAYADLKAELDTITADLQAMNKDAQTNSVTWSDEQKVEQRKKMDYKLADRELVTKKLRQEETTLAEKILQGQVQSALAIANDLVKAEGIGLLLNAAAVDANGQRMVFHVDSSYDITAKVTDRLNGAK